MSQPVDPQQQMPAEPLTLLGAAAAEMHEMRNSFIDAGFTPEQAFRLVLARWTEQIRFGLSGGAS